MAHGQKPTSNVISKQRVKTQMACKTSGFKAYRPLVRPIETQSLCTTAATQSKGSHPCYSSDVCGHSTTVHVYVKIHFINEYTVPNCR